MIIKTESGNFEYPIKDLIYFGKYPNETAVEYKNRMSAAVHQGRQFIAAGGLKVLAKQDSMTYTPELAEDFLKQIEETILLK